MKKRAFILIAISLIVQFTGIMLPFIGLSKNGFIVTTLPFSYLVSLILLICSLISLTKEYRNFEFNKSIKFFIITILVLIVGTVVSPYLVKDEYCNIFKYIILSMDEGLVNDEEYVLNLTYNFFDSYRAVFIIYLLSSIFYMAGIFKLTSGTRMLNLSREHNKNLKQNFRRFTIVNTLLLTVTVVLLTLLIGMFKLSSKEVLDYFEAIGLLIYLVLMFLVICPLAIVLSVFFYIYMIKSIILLFKTPSKFIEENTEVYGTNI